MSLRTPCSTVKRSGLTARSAWPLNNALLSNNKYDYRGGIMKKLLIIIGSVLFVIIAASGLLFWEQYQRIMAMEIIRYDPQLMIYLGGGGNTIVLTSEDGSRALIIDTKMFSGSKKLRESVKAGDTIIVNTHSHWDHTGGNPLFSSEKFLAGAYTREQGDRESAGGKYPDMVLKPGGEWRM